MHTIASPNPTNSAMNAHAGKSTDWVTTPLLMVVVASGVCDHPNAPAATTIRNRKNVLTNAPFAVMCETRVDGGGAPVASEWASATGAAQPASSSFSMVSYRFWFMAGLGMGSSCRPPTGVPAYDSTSAGEVRADPGRRSLDSLPED